MKTDDILREIAALSVEERALVVDSVLRSLNPPDAAVDAQWADTARRRLNELRSGKVAAVPGEEVFADAWK